MFFSHCSYLIYNHILRQRKSELIQYLTCFKNSPLMRWLGFVAKMTRFLLLTKLLTL